ncbi:FAD-dependent oxidoreductase [Enterococcus faecalis]|uniref:FAD-dependent oxidoreductase n=1 Tax=Enterococcus faecalis TaxID=1351 RepID=A0A974NZ24_ENTFL|nr:FAD-dependent oxidoreductase [Enterococcus faecalis]
MITVKHETEILTEHYDKLILSPGAKPFVPPITGLAEAKKMFFSLRNVPDLDQIMTALTPETKRAVVIGAGFIGLEMAENLQKRGLEVTLVEKKHPMFLPPLDEEMAAFCQKQN